jgi:hypothetical protein
MKQPNTCMGWKLENEVQVELAYDGQDTALILGTESIDGKSQTVLLEQRTKET